MDIEKLKEQITRQGKFDDRLGGDESCNVTSCTTSCQSGCPSSCASGCSSTGCSSSCYAPGSNIRESRR